MNMVSPFSLSNRSEGTRKFWELIGHQFRQSKGTLALACLCLIGTTITETLAPWPLKIIFDHILLDNPIPPTLSFLHPLLLGDTTLDLLIVSSGILLIALAKGGFSYFNIYLSSRIGYQIVHKLRVILFDHLQQLSLAFHRKSRTGELLTRITADTKALRNFFTDTLMSSLIHLFTLVTMFTIMFAMNWQLSLLILATLPVTVLAITYFYRRLRDSAQKQRKQEGKLAAELSEILGAIPLVQAFGREQFEQARIESISSKSLAHGIKAARTAGAATRTVDIIIALGKWAVVCFGSFLVLKGDMTPGDILIFAAYGTQLYKPVQNLTKFSSKYSTAMVSAARLSELLDIAPGIQDPSQPIRPQKLKGEIEFRKVSFGYRKDRRVLRNVSFHVQPGQRVALVGTSGSGKSTIVGLLLRLYDPTKGTIFIDGIDLTHYHRESLRQHIGLVLQEPLLFRQSVKDNIAYGKPDATFEEIQEAARQAFIHDVVMAMPDQYETKVGERGGTLSGGQRQRLCLARALLKQPSLLILDEPTSAIDSESANLIRQAVLKKELGTTVLFIAHQFSSMEQFDQILVLKNGVVVEHGHHAGLLDLKGHYYDLVTA